MLSDEVAHVHKHEVSGAWPELVDGEGVLALFLGKSLFQPFLQKSDVAERLGADAIQAVMERLQLLVSGPARHIRKAVIGCVQPEVLTHHIGNTLGLAFFGCSIQRHIFRGIRCDVMTLAMGDFMHQCLDGLKLAHAFPHHNLLLGSVHVAQRFAGEVLKADGQRGKLNQRLLECLVLSHTALQHSVVDCGQGFALCLRNVVNVHGLIGGNLDLHLFHHGLAVGVLDGEAQLVHLGLFLHDGLGDKAQNPDALFSLAHLPMKFLLPAFVAAHQCGVGPLHTDEQAVIDGVVSELCHGVHHGLVAFTLKDSLRTFLNLLEQFIHFFFPVSHSPHPPQSEGCPGSPASDNLPRSLP